ncbi:nucleotidyltransferase domain-containing protein [Candidatus Woesearchaeota archaeon]|nr:nucleotidyltransferase domain-containing protein [Candidatus Woesearchaeota archaeon]
MIHTKLVKICKSYKKVKDLDDIILFGSLMRGKKNPEDVDILLVFKNKVSKDLEYDLRKNLEKIIVNVSLLSKTKIQLIDEFFEAREGVFFEGYSLFREKFIAEERGFKSFGLFIYQTKNLSNSKKTNFYYVLNGRRSNKGMIEELEAIKLSNNLLLVELGFIEQTKEFLDFWTDYTYVPVMMPLRLAHKKFLELNF